jgi:hypothetical protein
MKFSNSKNRDFHGLIRDYYYMLFINYDYDYHYCCWYCQSAVRKSESELSIIN